MSKDYNKQYREEKKTEVYYVSAEYPLNVRCEANIESDVKKTINPGTYLLLKEDLGEWCQIDCGGTIGFVMKEFIKKVNHA